MARSSGSLQARPQKLMFTGSSEKNPMGTVMAGYPAMAAGLELPASRGRRPLQVAARAQVDALAAGAAVVTGLVAGHGLAVVDAKFNAGANDLALGQVDVGAVPLLVCTTTGVLTEVAGAGAPLLLGDVGAEGDADAFGNGQLAADPQALVSRVREYHVPEVEAKKAGGRPDELRTYGVGAQIIADLGIHRMRVLSAPKIVHGIAGFGLEVVEYVPCELP